MCKSLTETLMWYRDEAIKLSAASKKPALLKEISLNLINDHGNRAKDALDAIAYAKTDVDVFNKLVSNIISSIKLSTNVNYSADKRYLHEQFTRVFISELCESLNNVLSTPTLEIRDACSKVITNATAELLKSINEKA